MKRFVVFFIAVVAGLSGFSQIKLPQVRGLESQGWRIQHSVMSWDSLRVYFSAQAPGDTHYDLFVVNAEGRRWGEPQRIALLRAETDALWPSVSSDERMLFFVRDSKIWRAWQRNGKWEEAAPIIISKGEDSQPRILEDNRTLLFLRREVTKKNDGPWRPYSAIMMDDHDWTLPQEYTEEPKPMPVMAVSGSIVIRKGRRPLASGRVLVYDAMNEQLLQEARVHPVSGSWRVALQPRMQYRLALTAEGYSYHYIDVRTDTLQVREERRVGTIALDNRLELTLNTYDAETQQILRAEQKNLPLGQLHSVVLQQEGYEDTTLVVNTQRPTVFTETELDIAMRPKKSRHLFIVSDSKSGQLIEQVTLRLNGKETPVDTCLRIEQEVVMQASAPGYLFYDTVLHTGHDTYPHTIRLRLQPLERGLVLQLRNIQFEYDSYELTEDSNDELESLAQLLFMNPTLRIELSAHTDDQGSDRYNDRLSTLRGQAVAAWLVRRGIDSARMESKGYGKRKPLVENDSEEHRALNRRVEIQVLDF